MDKQYLGDGVYSEFDGYDSIILTTENGESITNRIILESEVLFNLNNYIEKIKAKNS